MATLKRLFQKPVKKFKKSPWVKHGILHFKLKHILIFTLTSSIFTSLGTILLIFLIAQMLRLLDS